MLIRSGTDKTHFAQSSQPSDGRVQLGTLWSNTGSNELYICIQVTPSIQFQLLTGGTGAPVGSPYVTFSTDGTLSNERVLTAGTNITLDTSVAGQLTISAAGGGASALDDLSDVVITAAASGDFVRHNGTNWVDAVIAAGDIPTGVDAAKVADGSVSNAEFQRLNGVTSDIQTQIDGKAATVHTHVKADVTDLETITATPSAGAVPLADGSNKLANGWLNTGSGNGLDADTVDGQHASAFAAAVHSHVKADVTDFAHATAHQSGGGDAIKLDDLAAPDDNTDLDATTSAHGLLPKLGGGSTNFLRADGTWATPPGTGGGGAPTDASYVVIGTNATLSDERVLTAGSGISISDGGAGSTVTISATGGGSDNEIMEWMGL